MNASADMMQWHIKTSANSAHKKAEADFATGSHKYKWRKVVGEDPTTFAFRQTRGFDKGWYAHYIEVMTFHRQLFKSSALHALILCEENIPDA